MGTQRALKRRELVAGFAALVASSQLTGCARRDRAAILDGLVREVVGAMARDVLTESRRLQAQVRGLAEQPTQDRLAEARQSFKVATLAWKRASAFRAGPFASSSAFQQAAFWPARPSAIDAVLASPGPIDEPRVEALGVDARGLYALEYLLFEGAPGASLASAEPAASRGRDYALELSANILGYASRMARLLGDGSRYARSFAAGGQSSVSELVAQSLDTLTMVLGKFARVERASEESLPLVSAVEGYFSHASLDVVRAILDGTRQLYRGGLGELVQLVSKPIDEHVREAFTGTDSVLRALGLPLELALRAEPARFHQARAAVEQLKHVMQVEMASALEV